MSFSERFSLASSALAIDLGTANTVVYAPGSGIVLAEPSVVAIETTHGVKRILAVGSEAKLMMGKTPENIKTIRPLRHGVLSDFDVAELMIKHFIRKSLAYQGKFRARSEIVVCVPSGSTSVERRAIRDAASNAGARRVWLIDEPMAAAIGAGLPVTEPVGSMVVDLGGGTTEIGVISTGGMSLSMSTRVGGDDMDDAIVAHVRKNHNLLIGEATAERLKKELGTARLSGEAGDATALVRGRELGRGVPMEVSITRAEIANALTDSVAQIVLLVRRALEDTPPEIAADILDSGMVLTGGGSLLADLVPILVQGTGLSVRIAEGPLDCVAVGAGQALESPALQAVLQEG